MLACNSLSTRSNTTRIYLKPDMMRKLLATSLIVLTSSFCALAQEKGQLYFPELEQKNVSVKIEQPLVFINGQETTLNNLILSHDNIAETNLLVKGTPEAKKHDPTGEKNVALLKTKEGIELVQLDHILDQFSIHASQRNLQVSINRRTLVKPELLLADLSEIETVEVIEAGAREFVQWGWNQGDKFLNIVTKKQD